MCHCFQEILSRVSSCEAASLVTSYQAVGGDCTGGEKAEEKAESETSAGAAIAIVIRDGENGEDMAEPVEEEKEKVIQPGC